MFPSHDPAQQTFNYYCELSGATEIDSAMVAMKLRDYVRGAREIYRNPFESKIPYNNHYFQIAYLIAYFPYYIEPLWHALSDSDIPSDIFEKNSLKASFFGGGPCPEVLGLAAYLKTKAPHLRSVQVSVLDRETSWLPVQKVLVPDMIHHYASPQTDFNIHSRQCNLIDCLKRKCTCSAVCSDLIIAQNFLTEIYKKKGLALQTFEKLIKISGCRYLVFVENHYGKVKELMDNLSEQLHARGITVSLNKTFSKTIMPNFQLPRVLRDNLFTGESGLIAKKYVKFHYMALEIVRRK